MISLLGLLTLAVILIVACRELVHQFIAWPRYERPDARLSRDIRRMR